MTRSINVKSIGSVQKHFCELFAAFDVMFCIYIFNVFYGLGWNL